MTRTLAAAILASVLLLPGGADARTHHGRGHATHHGRGGARCRLGLFFRPSLGTCSRTVPHGARVDMGHGRHRPVAHHARLALGHGYHRHAWAPRVAAHARPQAPRHLALPVGPASVAGVVAATTRAVPDAAVTKVPPWAGTLTRPRFWQ